VTVGTTWRVLAPGRPRASAGSQRVAIAPTTGIAHYGRAAWSIRGDEPGFKHWHPVNLGWRKPLLLLVAGREARLAAARAAIDTLALAGVASIDTRRSGSSRGIGAIRFPSKSRHSGLIAPKTLGNRTKSTSCVCRRVLFPARQPALTSSKYL
jgi:hypothetical protein